MVHELPIPLIHTSPINHNDMSFPTIVHGKDFPRVADQAKKVAFKGILVCQTLPRKKKAIITTYDTIEGLTLNNPLLMGTH